MSYELPADISEVPSSPRGHWPAKHEGPPDGAPLYPVATIRWFETKTAPTRRRRQSARRATAAAIPRKYSSQPGRVKAIRSGDTGLFRSSGLCGGAGFSGMSVIVLLRTCKVRQRSARQRVLASPAIARAFGPHLDSLAGKPCQRGENQDRRPERDGSLVDVEVGSV